VVGAFELHRQIQYEICCGQAYTALLDLKLAMNFADQSWVRSRSRLISWLDAVDVRMRRSVQLCYRADAQASICGLVDEQLSPSVIATGQGHGAS